MSNQVLFIDDDESLLSTMKRNLGMDFRVQTAAGIEAAFEVIAEHGDFSVVIVDMQMPKIDGIQGIGMLREKMPEAVYVMLTGNQDITTAMGAINEGKVFRFLNKPCQVAEISTAIRAAQDQHNLVISERELLSGTFAGAISMLTDIIDLQQDHQIDTGRMCEALVDLADRLSLELGWEEKVAAKVFLVGISLLDSEDDLKFSVLNPTDDEHRKIFAKICKESAAMLAKLPRLSWIVDLLKSVPQAEAIDSAGDRKQAAAVLLKAVFYWNFLTNKGMCAEAATSVIEQIMPQLGNRFITAMQSLHDNHDAHTLVKVPVTELKAGMIPHADITVPGGGFAVSKGRLLTEPQIQNLGNLPALQHQPIAVIANSVPRELTVTT